jgi:CelD/BcsL family acetyltransferase involved in cellulose biosynthesis
MPIEVLKANQLSDAQWNGWAALQASVAAYGSPYFDPRFTRAVAAERDDVEVAIISEGGEDVGFFPFQRGPGRNGKPVSGRLSDFHGVISRPGTRIELETLLRACGLKGIAFDHLITAHQPATCAAWPTAPSHWIDLSGGFAAYRADRLEKTDETRKLERKMRKLEREVGPIEFEWHSEDERAWEVLQRWKSEQYQSTGFTDVFAYPWTLRLLRRLAKEQSPDFGGVLSTLRVNGNIIAVHYGMRCRNVLHSWFPAYDRAMSKHSPGLTQIYRLCMAMPEQGVTRFDFGKGSEEYKVNLSTHTDYVAEGFVDRRPLGRLARKAWSETRTWVKSSRWLRTAAEIPLRLLRPLRERRAFE